MQFRSKSSSWLGNLSASQDHTTCAQPLQRHPKILPFATFRQSQASLNNETYPMLPKQAACKPPVVLTIAGSDSGGGAGIQADLKTIAACGAYGVCAVTALTAQNTHGVVSVAAVSADDVGRQIGVVLDDFPVSVVKTGLLPSVQIVEEVAKALRIRPYLRLVVDPVLVATSGDALASKQVGAAISDKLFPLATLVTPNILEAASILGIQEISDVSAMQSAAEQLLTRGTNNVLLKGGHLKGRTDVPDVLHDGTAMHVMLGQRIQTDNTHGTGCTMASAVASFLAKGLSVTAAARAAKSYVAQALQESSHLRIGSGPQRPFNHCFAMHSWRDSCSVDLDLRLYAVTDADCNKRTGRSNQQSVEQAILGGATVIQLREKSLDAHAFCKEAEAVLAIARPQGVKVLINDRVDVALATGADGVHLGQEDLPIQHARRLIGPDMLLGASVKTVDQARQAEAEGADYLGAGAVYTTSTKRSSTIEMGTLATICEAVRIPVVAIGGINAVNAGRCIEAGCQGVAVVSALFSGNDTAQTASDLLRVVTAAKQNVHTEGQS